MKQFVTVPTFFSFMRIALTPFIVHAILLSQWCCAGVLFAGAALTDFLDGYIARRFNQQSEFGAMIDPVADKILLISTFFAFAIKQNASASFLLFCFFVAFKEAVIMFGGLLLMISGVRVKIQPTLLGKFSTCMQIVLVLALLVSAALKTEFSFLPMLVAGVAGIVAASGIQYGIIGIQMIRKQR